MAFWGGSSSGRPGQAPVGPGRTFGGLREGHGPPSGAAGSLTTKSRYRLIFEKVVQKHLGEGGWKSQIYGKAPLGVVVAGKSTGVLYGDQDFVADRLLGF